MTAKTLRKRLWLMVKIDFGNYRLSKARSQTGHLVFGSNAVYSERGRASGQIVISISAAAFLSLTSVLCGADRLVPSVYPTIQAGIDAARTGEVVVLAEGTYTGSGNKDLDFRGKAITVRSRRPSDEPTVAATVIDCENSGRGFYFHSEETSASVVAGLTICHGSAGVGGAICCEGGSPTIKNCVFSDNWASTAGGAMEISNSSASITNCVLAGNRADWFGGGMNVCNSSITLTNCAFVRNTAYWGGGVENLDSALTVINCAFYGNSASDYGGAVDSYGTLAPSVTNSILWGNSAPDGAEISGDCKVSYSNVAGGEAAVHVGLGGLAWGPGNIDVDPCFASLDGADCHLKSEAGRWDVNTQSWIRDEVTSPCIDAGNPYSSIGWEPFPNGGRLNMGAYGGTETASKSHFGALVCEKPVAGDINGDCKVNSKDFAILAFHWLENSSE